MSPRRSCTLEYVSGNGFGAAGEGDALFQGTRRLSFVDRQQETAVQQVPLMSSVQAKHLPFFLKCDQPVSASFI